VNIKWAAIDQLSSDTPVYVTSKEGQILLGTVTTSGGSLQVHTKEAGEVTIAKDAVASVRSPEEQKSFQAWGGFIDAGLSTARGNSRTLDFNLSMNAARTTLKDKTSAYLTSLFSRNSTTGVAVTTAKAIRGGIRYDFNLGARTFAFGFTDLEYDLFQRLDLRNVLGGGVGYHAIKHERTTLDLFTGGSFDQEFFSTGLTRRSGEVLFGDELSYKLSKSTALKQRFVFYPNVTDLGQYRVQLDAAATAKLNNWLGWQVTLSDRYLSNPLPGLKGNDLLLTTGLRVSFGAGHL